MVSSSTAPRGRHAPPLEVRLEAQRERLLRAAATVFARVGYADATAEGIAREAGMSKATFYEHFSNKEDAILALFDASAALVLDGMTRAGEDVASSSGDRVRASARAFLGALAANPEPAQTLLVEIIGAGPRAAERRDAVMQRFVDAVDAMNEHSATVYGDPRFRSPDDAFAVVGAVVELASRQLRLGRPADIRDLEPVIERLVLGLLSQGR